MKRLILLILLLSLTGLLPGLTYIIKQDGSGHFTNIQAGLNACSPGDTVLVYPGRYYENLIIQTNGISLISLEAITGNVAYIDSTIVDGNHTGRCIGVNQHIQNVMIRGFSVTNGFTIGGAGGIGMPTNSSGHLENLYVYGNTAGIGGGINIGAASVFLAGVRIFDNYALLLGGGLYAAAGGGYVNNITFDPVNRCSIYNNRSGSGQDIYIQNSVSDLNVYLDTFSVAEQTTYHAVYLSQGLNSYQMQIDIWNAHHQEIDSDLYVSPDGDDANDGLSPSSPLKTIHEAIYRIAPDSLSRNTVHLLPGSYSRSENDQIFPIALKSRTIVQGGGMDNTEVIGSPHPLIPTGYGSYDAVFRSHFQYKVLLSNLSISTTDTDNGCAISGSRDTNIDLSSLRISGVSPEYVAVVHLWMTNDYDSVWDNVTIENIVSSNGGLLSINGAMSGRISNSKFRNATSTFVSGSVASQALVSIKGDRNLTFDNCEFSNLTMSDDNSVAVSISGVQFPEQRNNFSFNNCLFSNNTSQGGIVSVSSSNNPNISFTNCTIAGNESDSYNLTVNGNVDIRNTIFYNNTPSQIRVNPYYGQGYYSTLNIDHSFIKDGYAGIGQAAGNTINYSESNISGNPLFLGGDDILHPLYYSLSAGSPCINAGTSDTLGLFLPPYDLAGNWRVWDGRIDMGAFEYGSQPGVSSDEALLPALPELRLSAYPNPFNPNTTISYSIPSDGELSLCIYNARGQLVSSLVSGYRPRGEHRLTWQGQDANGNPLGSGLYLLRLVSGGRSVSRKLLLVK